MSDKDSVATMADTGASEVGADDDGDADERLDSFDLQFTRPHIERVTRFIYILFYCVDDADTVSFIFIFAHRDAAANWRPALFAHG